MTIILIMRSFRHCPPYSALHAPAPSGRRRVSSRRETRVSCMSLSQLKEKNNEHNGIACCL
uniref:Uncharacterized protein n=1 Tax=Anguilla anguilla TaxID=7936 RepID=A0A0E9PWA1_ANGAN